LDYGYALLIVAGLFVAVDQIFLASKNWSRFTLAGLAITLERQLLEIELSRFVKTTSDAIAGEKTELVHATAQKAREKVAAIIKQETEAWASALDQASARLEELIKGATSEARKDVDKERAGQDAAAQQQTGAIQVEFVNPERVSSSLVVSVGDMVRPVGKLTSKVVFEKQPVGLRRVRLSWSASGGTAGEMEEVPDVKPNAVSVVKFQLPQTGATPPLDGQ
jgi:hypothetical protein